MIVKNNVALVLLCSGVLVARISIADSIKLTSGKVFEGEIIEKTQEYIKMNTSVGEITIPIKSIDPDSLSSGGAGSEISEEEKAASFKLVKCS